MEQDPLLLLGGLVCGSTGNVGPLTGVSDLPDQHSGQGHPHWVDSCIAVRQLSQLDINVVEDTSAVTPEIEDFNYMKQVLHQGPQSCIAAAGVLVQQMHVSLSHMLIMPHDLHY